MLDLTEIETVDFISKEEFVNNYVNKQKPLVIKGLTQSWPAYKKWSLNYIKEVAGEKVVPLYDDRPVSYQDGFNQAHAKMKMGHYIDLLQAEPTRYRIFLWNILKEVPLLQHDFSFPDLGLSLLKKVPMLFFGGEDSYTFMHYDIDLANILHFHFEGKKEIILFDQQQTKYLYKVPHSLIVREDIDFSNPDLKKWPALKFAKGYKTYLNHGDTLYMPEGYWHYMRYITPGFSMSLRALPKHAKNLSKALYNIAIMRHFDGVMRKLKGQKWIDEKNRKAIINTHKHLIKLS